MAKTVYPLPAEIIKYVDAADNAKLESRDPQKLFDLLHKFPDVNPRISGHILTRTTAVSSFSYRIVADDGNEALAEKAELRLRKAIAFFVQRHALTHVFGHQGYRLKWEKGEYGMFPKELDAIPYSQIQCYQGEFAIKNGDKFKVAEPSPELFLDATSSGNTQGGVMRTVLWGEILRWDALKEQGNFIKKLKGILQIINKGGGDTEQADAEQAAATATKDNYLITSDMIEFKLNSIVAGSGESFKSAIELLNADIAIAFLGQANTSELPNNGGSRAALQVMRLISADIHYSDIIHLENFINSQLLKYDYELNVSADKEVPYRFEIALEEEIDIETNASAVEAMLRTKLPFLRSELYAKLGMSVPDEADDTYTLVDVI